MSVVSNDTVVRAIGELCLAFFFPYQLLPKIFLAKRQEPT